VTDEVETVEKKPGETLAKYREKYGKEGHTGDDIAIALAENSKGEDGKADHGKLLEIASQNKIDLVERWGHLNVGMQRMNLGNVLRGMHKKGQDVHIGNTTVDGAETDSE